MFWKISKYIVLLLIVVGVSIWFAENPGTVSVQWQGVIIDVPLALFLIASLVLIGICALAYRLWIAVIKSPKVFGHYREEKRLHHGYDELSKGMVAIAAGDPAQARKHAKKAETFLHNPAMTMLLSAQAAQLDGDDGAATKFFEEMSTTPGMEFLGLRGLFNQAMARGDLDEALTLAQKAFIDKPKSAWLARALFDLQIGKSKWADAEATLDRAESVLSSEEMSVIKQKSILITQRGIEANDFGQTEQAIKLFKKAHNYSLAFVPPVLLLAEIYTKQGEKRKALAAIEEVWAQTPHPELFKLYQDLNEQPDALKRVKQTEKLVSKNRTHPESRIAITRACIEAQLWGEARKELDQLDDEHKTQRVYAMLSEMEESEHGDLSASQKWLRRMPSAPMDETWTCSHCGTMAEEWSATCGHCNSFGTVEWQAPVTISKKLIREQSYQDAPLENVEVEVVTQMPTSKSA